MREGHRDKPARRIQQSASSATGTNLGGKIFVGDAWYWSGPDGMHAAAELTENALKAAGLPLRRFKTGTPARVHRRSIDFLQAGTRPAAGQRASAVQLYDGCADAQQGRVLHRLHEP